MLGNESTLLAIQRLEGKVMRVHPPVTHSVVHKDQLRQVTCQRHEQAQSLLLAGRGTPSVNLLGFPKTAIRNKIFKSFSHFQSKTDTLASFRGPL